MKRKIQLILGLAGIMLFGLILVDSGYSKPNRRKYIDWKMDRCSAGKEPGSNHSWKKKKEYPLLFKYDTDGNAIEKKRMSKKADRNTCFSSFRLKSNIYQIWHNGLTAQTPGKPWEFEIGDDYGVRKNWTWGILFHDAGVAHDFCYHHNPSTYKISRQRCDSYFLTDMLNICSKVYKEEENNNWKYRKCARKAHQTYRTVHDVSLSKFNRFDVYTPYLKLPFMKDMAQGKDMPDKTLQDGEKIE